MLAFAISCRSYEANVNATVIRFTTYSVFAVSGNEPQLVLRSVQVAS